MNAARWERVQTLFHHAADLPEAERRQYVVADCADDPSVADEVLALLDEDVREALGARPRRRRTWRARSLDDAGRARYCPSSSSGRIASRRCSAKAAWASSTWPSARPREQGRDQDPARRVAVAGTTRAIRRRAAHAGAAQPSVHRAALRRRHACPTGRRGSSWSTSRACRSRSTATRTRPRSASGCELFRDGVRGGAARAPARDHPPRPQAVEHPGRRRRHGEAARLRHREAAREPRGVGSRRGRGCG